MSIKIISKEEYLKQKEENKIKKCKISEKSKSEVEKWGEKYCRYCRYYELKQYHAFEEDEAYCHYYGTETDSYGTCSNYEERE